MAKSNSIHWAEVFDTSGADEAAERFTALVLDAVEACVPSRWITEKLHAHPHLNDACREAMERKHASAGSPDFPAARNACMRVFRNTHEAYVCKAIEDLKKLAPLSRGWWKLCGALLTKAAGRENILPLSRSGDEWAKSASDKSTELARVFREKSLLTDGEVNQCTPRVEFSEEQMLKRNAAGECT